MPLRSQTYAANFHFILPVGDLKLTLVLKFQYLCDLIFVMNGFSKKPKPMNGGVRVPLSVEDEVRYYSLSKRLKKFFEERGLKEKNLHDFARPRIYEAMEAAEKFLAEHETGKTAS